MTKFCNASDHSTTTERPAPLKKGSAPRRPMVQLPAMKLPFLSLALFGALLLVALCTVRPALADTSRSHEVKNARKYGNCGVLTLVDMFTDEAAHGFSCLEETLTDKTQISVRSERDGLAYISLSKGLQFHVEGFIPVAIRIDKGSLIRRSAYWDSSNSTAYILDGQLARQLLHDLARGNRVAIQVGDERGHIRLNGSQRAIADFRQRAGLQPQQTLEIPARAF